MKELSPKGKVLINQLKSGQVAEMMLAVQKIREDGKPEFVPHLLQAYQKHHQSDAGKAIEKILVELKVQESEKYIVEAIKKKEYLDIRQFLISLAWQTGLDFSASADLFLDILVHENDFMIAFEAFTVLENMDEHYSKLNREHFVETLKGAAVKADEQKRYLFMDLIHALQDA